MGLREIKKNRTRQQILATARELFLQRGFAATRIRDISERLEISEQTVFKHFPSKHAIVEALAEAWVLANARAAAAQAGSVPASDSVLATVRLRAARNLQALTDERDFIRLLLDHSSLGVLQPRRRKALATDSGMLRGTRAQLELAAQGYRLAQQRGEIRPDVNPDDLAEMVLTVTGTCLRAWVDTQPAPDLVELVFRRVGLLMQGARFGPPLDIERALAEARGKA